MDKTIVWVIGDDNLPISTTEDDAIYHAELNKSMNYSFFYDNSTCVYAINENMISRDNNAEHLIIGMKGLICSAKLVDDYWHGIINNNDGQIPHNHCILVKGETLKDFVEDFKEAVDDYIDTIANIYLEIIKADIKNKDWTWGKFNDVTVEEIKKYIE